MDWENKKYVKFKNIIMETKTKALEFIEANKFVCDNGEDVVLKQTAKKAIEIAFEEGQKSPKFRKLDWHGTYCQTEFGTLTYSWTSNGYATLTLNSPKNIIHEWELQAKNGENIVKEIEKVAQELMNEKVKKMLNV